MLGCWASTGDVLSLEPAKCADAAKALHECMRTAVSNKICLNFTWTNARSSRKIIAYTVRLSTTTLPASANSANHNIFLTTISRVTIHPIYWILHYCIAPLELLPAFNMPQKAEENMGARGCTGRLYIYMSRYRPYTGPRSNSRPYFGHQCPYFYDFRRYFSFRQARCFCGAFCMPCSSSISLRDHSQRVIHRGHEV